jgi:hypothetical protein
MPPRPDLRARQAERVSGRGRQEDSERRYRVGTELRSVSTPSSSMCSPSRCQLRESHVEHDLITNREPSMVNPISTSSFLHTWQLDMTSSQLAARAVPGPAARRHDLSDHSPSASTARFVSDRTRNEPIGP